jgi:hypothetical protein
MLTQCITELTRAEIKRLGLAISDPAIFKAALDYNALKNRKVNPAGSFDNGRRFYLAHKYDCCKGIRSPSRAYPYSQMTHGSSSVHIANIHGVEPLESEVKSYARLMEKYPTLAESHDIAIVLVSQAAARKAMANLDMTQPRKSTAAKHAE